MQDRLGTSVLFCVLRMIVKFGSQAALGEVAHSLVNVPEATFPVLLSPPGREQDLPVNLSFSFFKASVLQLLLKPRCHINIMESTVLHA